MWRLKTLDLLGGSVKMQVSQAFITHVRHELAFYFLMLAFGWKGGKCARGGCHLGGKACGSCKMPTGSHYTWVLSGSFRTPKNFLPLNGAFGKTEVHWNYKQTQEESENQRGGGWKREKWVGGGGAVRNHNWRHFATAEKEEVQSKDNVNNRVAIYNWSQLSALKLKNQREVKLKPVWW